MKELIYQLRELAEEFAGLIWLVVLLAAFGTVVLVFENEPTETKCGVVTDVDYLAASLFHDPVTIFRYDDGITFLVDGLHDIKQGKQTIIRGKWTNNLKKIERP